MKNLGWNTRIYVTEDVQEYRRVALRLVTKDDTVLEIGCADGKTCYLLSKVAKRVVGIDKSKKSIERAREKYKGKNIEFYCLDGYNVREVLKLGRFSFILIDISGSRRVEDVIRMMVPYLRTMSPRVMIVKNRPLLRIVRSLAEVRLMNKIFSRVTELIDYTEDFQKLVEERNIAGALVLVGYELARKGIDKEEILNVLRECLN